MAEENRQSDEQSVMTLLPGGGKSITIGPNQITYKLGGEQTGGAFSMIEYRVAPGFAAPPALHFHTRESWAGYVLEGTLGFQLGEETIVAKTGSTLFVPRGLPFKWWNAEERPARYLAIYFPAGFERYFEEIADLTKELPPGPLDMSRLMPRILPLWEKYGIGTKTE
jgi:quercetin dioxygenase-like cupin family protein